MESNYRRLVNDEKQEEIRRSSSKEKKKKFDKFFFFDSFCFSSKNFIRKGFPEHFRPLVWQLLTENEANQCKQFYIEHLNVESAYDKVIRRDLNRTYPTHPLFKDENGSGQESLFNVIKVRIELKNFIDPLLKELPFVSGLFDLRSRSRLLSRNRFHRRSFTDARSFRCLSFFVRSSFRRFFSFPKKKHFLCSFR